MPIKLKKSDIKDKIDNPAEGYMILGFDERGTLVWKDEDGGYGTIVPSVEIGKFDILEIGNYLTVGYRLTTVGIGLYSIAHGNDIAASGLSSYAQGSDALAMGDFSTAKGEYVEALGTYSYVSGKGWLVDNKLTSSGISSFVHSYADADANSGISGTWSDYSVILGGKNHLISDDIHTGSTYSSDNSFILGGDTNYIGYRSNNSGIIGGNNNEIDNDVENSVIIGGSFINATVRDAVYVPRIMFKADTYVPSVGNDQIGTIEYKTNPTTGKKEFFSYSESTPNGSLLGGVYQTELDQNIVSSYTVGGFTANVTKVGDISGKTFTKIFDDMLFPKVAPNYIAPSITSFTTTTPGPFNIIGNPILLNFSCVFDKGQIRIVSTFKDFRSGNPDNTDGFCYSGDGLPPQVGYSGSLTNNQSNISSVLALGQNQYKAKVHWTVGPDAKYSDGTFYEAGLAANYTSWSTINIEGVYVFYATTVDSTLTAQSPISFSTNPYPVGNIPGAYGLLLVAETAAHQQAFDIPNAWGVLSNVWTYSPSFNSWSQTGLAEWTNEGTQVHNGINYTRYRYAGAQRDATRIRLQK